jgi:hypothetical protein
MESRYCKECWRELLLKEFRWFWQWKIRVFCNKKCYSLWKEKQPCSDERKKIMSEKMTWRKITWRDKLRWPKFNDEQKLKMSINHLWDKNPSWRWWTSTEKYWEKWTKGLKNKIRSRDKYICFICKKVEKNKSFSVHHINYNKKDCSENNLITLCWSCHQKTNFNRDRWILFFNHPEKAIKGWKARAKQK